MLALEGIPAVYIQSLFGSRNDFDRLKHTGRNRSINRHIWQVNELEQTLANQKSNHAQVFEELRRLLEIRKNQSAFHPNATQFTLHLGAAVFAFWRQSMNRDQSVFCLSNVTTEVQLINLSDINLITTDTWRDLISEEILSDLGSQLSLQPYQTLWISNS